MRAIWIVLLLLPMAGCNRAPETQTIECPAPENGQAADTVRETPAQIAAAGQQLHYGNSNAIGEVAGSVRQRHPDATRGAIINYLLTAYCPALNADGALDRKARQHAMSSFAKQVEAAVK